MTVPRPRQLGQVVTMRNMPPKPCWATRPCPPHCTQTTGDAAGLGAGALAGFAVVLPLELDRLLGPGRDLLQGQLDLGFEVEPALPGPAAPRRPRAADAPAEQIVRSNIEKMSPTSMSRKSCCPETPAWPNWSYRCRLPSSREDLVRLGAFLELDLGFVLLVLPGAVGVVLHRQPAVGALDLLAVAVRVTPSTS